MTTPAIPSLTRRTWGLWATATTLALAGCGGGDDDTVVTAQPTGAYLSEAGVGVADLEVAVTFYRALGMVERTRITRSDRREVILDSADARGSRLVLFNYTDGRTVNYRRNPGKIVFYVRDPAAFATAFHTAATAAGSGGITAPPTALPGGTIVGFGRDPNNNLVEIATPLATDPAAAQTHSYISAFGVGVSNLQAARNFYVNALDMRESQFLSITRPAAGGGTTPWYDEYILVSPTGRGSAIVLMTFTDGVPRNYTNNPVKLTLAVTDPASYAQRITSAGVTGATVVRAPAPERELGGAVVGYATDADGTTLEILKSPI